MCFNAHPKIERHPRKVANPEARCKGLIIPKIWTRRFTKQDKAAETKGKGDFFKVCSLILKTIQTAE